MNRLAGYRKLLALLGLAICATVLQALGRFDGVIAAFLGSIYGGLVVGNVGEHLAQARRPPPLPRPPGKRPPAKPSPMVASALAAGLDLRALRAELEALDRKEPSQDVRWGEDTRHDPEGP